MGMNDREQAFLDILKSRNYSSCTVANYTAAVRDFRAYCPQLGYDREPVEYVRQYVLALQKFKHPPLDPSTINLNLAAIRLYYKTVLGVDVTIKDLPNLKTAKKLPGVFSLEEMRAILSAPMNSKHRLFLMVVYGCGLRVGEAVKIRVKDIHLDRGLLCVRGKGDKDRVISIMDIPVELLKAQMHGKGQDGWLFESQGTQDHICKRTASKILEHACQKAGIVARCNIHKLRHTFAVHHLEQGTDCRFIQKMLGHNNIKTTMIYTSVSNEALTKIKSPLSKVL